MMQSVKILFLAVLWLCALTQNAHTQAIIPAPAKQSSRGYDAAKIRNLRFIYSSNKELLSDLDVFLDFCRLSGLPTMQKKVSTYDAVHLQIDNSLGDEGYRILNKPRDVIEIRGGRHGVFYGLMSLLQVMAQVQQQPSLTLNDIHDQPAFSWRGMHLDVSRHFFPVSFIKTYIDLLALHKMNTFHWHLTDDQGWRIEIKKYPLLTSVGSKRSETMVAKNFDPYVGDGKPVEGFYTQAEIKDVVAYAALRHITVVPEIEMPGHAQAALSAYPEFSCTKKPLSPLTKWGVSDDVFCTQESSFHFLTDILNEVMDLFPSQYIHIGGDEVPKVRWKACKVCQQTMKRNGLKTEEELQSYFIKRIDKYVSSKGRSIIGWDEILEGGLAPNAAVMSWRGEEGGIAAAKLKHKVVMSPGTHCYFDHYQGNKNTEPLAIGGFTPIEKVYAYQPIPAALSESERKYVLGAQANVWTEYMPTSSHVEYMALPRMCALAEVLWTGEKRPGFDDFKQRLRAHFRLLDRLKINYAQSIFDVTAVSSVKNNQIEVKLNSHYRNDSSSIRYYFRDEEDAGKLKTYDSSSPILIDRPRILMARYHEKQIGFGTPLTEEYYVHAGIGKQIKSSIEPNPSYQTGGMKTLLDGKVGRPPRLNSEWLAWSGKHPELTIDLGTAQPIRQIGLFTLLEEMNWIYLPASLTISLSSDGTSFSDVLTMGSKDIDAGYAREKMLNCKFPQTEARYIRIALTCAPQISSNKPGAGEPAWLFLSEIVID
jgi:hexosaminidase